MRTIYHFITKSNLDRYLDRDTLQLPSLISEGFIYCSTIEQVLDVANFLEPYSEEMQLLEIDEAELKPEVRYENAMQNGRLFPHVYGPINRNAIVAVHHLEWDGEDGYSLPEALRNDLA